jgi:hypothetical protein
LVYVFYSLIPYIFSNLKSASYADFKAGQVSQSAAVFVHQQDYAKMIFELNIAKDKREEFFKETIREDVLTGELSI